MNSNTRYPDSSPPRTRTSTRVLSSRPTRRLCLSPASLPALVSSLRQARPSVSPPRPPKSPPLQSSRTHPYRTNTSPRTLRFAGVCTSSVPSASVCSLRRGEGTVFCLRRVRPTVRRSRCCSRERSDFSSFSWGVKVLHNETKTRRKKKKKKKNTKWNNSSFSRDCES